MAPYVSSNLLLVVTPDADHGDRYARSLAEAGNFGFLFANDVDTAFTFAAGMVPDLTITALAGLEGVALCQRLRGNVETRTLRVLLVIDRNQLSAARDAGANAIVLEPASGVLVAFEANVVLSRPERREVWRVDRRIGAFRGGRRATDIAAE